MASFIIIELDKLHWHKCRRQYLSKEYIIRGVKGLKTAAIKFINNNKNIKRGEFIVMPRNRCMIIDANRIKMIRETGNLKHIK